MAIANFVSQFDSNIICIRISANGSYVPITHCSPLDRLLHRKRPPAPLAQHRPCSCHSQPPGGTLRDRHGSRLLCRREVLALGQHRRKCEIVVYRTPSVLSELPRFFLSCLDCQIFSRKLLFFHDLRRRDLGLLQHE